MPRAATLKVFRTPIGFHDAYVAAPSQKAALAAFGSDKNLFARGEAERVTDPKLIEEPLARPGEVIKRLRGTAAEQIAALPPDKPSPAAKAKAIDEAAGSGKAKVGPAKRKPAPRPSRAALDAAEQALAETDERHARERKALADRQAALERERRAMEKAEADEVTRLMRARDKAADAFEAAMRQWRSAVARHVAQRCALVIKLPRRCPPRVIERR